MNEAAELREALQSMLDKDFSVVLTETLKEARRREAALVKVRIADKKMPGKMEVTRPGDFLN